MCYCELIAGNAKITLKVSKFEGKYGGPTPDSNPGFRIYEVFLVTHTTPPVY